MKDSRFIRSSLAMAVLQGEQTRSAKQRNLAMVALDGARPENSETPAMERQSVKDTRIYPKGAREGLHDNDFHKENHTAEQANPFWELSVNRNHHKDVVKEDIPSCTDG